MVCQNINNFQKRICGNSFNQKHENLCLSKYFFQNNISYLTKYFWQWLDCHWSASHRFPYLLLQPSVAYIPPFIHKYIQTHNHIQDTIEHIFNLVSYCLKIPVVYFFFFFCPFVSSTYFLFDIFLRSELLSYKYLFFLFLFVC